MSVTTARPRPRWRPAAASVATAAVLAASACAAPATPPRSGSAAASGVDPLFSTIGNAGYDATAYDVSYDYHPGSTVMPASVVVDAVAQHRLAQISLDAGQPEIASVVVDGEPARFGLVRATEKLVVVPARPVEKGKRFTVRIAFTADRSVDPLSPTLNLPAGTDLGWKSWIETPDGFALLGQPDRAHLFFPCDDIPGDKARTTFHVTVPDDLEVVANGARTSVVPAPERRKTITYRTREEIPTDVVQVAVGRFLPVSQPGPHGTTLTGWIPADHPELAPAVRESAEQLRWVESTLGLRYPFESYGVLGVDSDYDEAALETATLPTYPVSTLSLPTEQRSPTMVHELVHQWFGDAVSVSTWDDMWLSEGHAMYYQHLWEAQHGGPSMDETMRELYSTYGAARAEDGPPGHLKIPFGVLFDTNTPGSLLLYGLREKVGEKTFRRIEQTFFREHVGGSASTADYAETASRVAGEDLGPYVDGWVHGAKVPAMPGHPGWRSDGDPAS